MTHVAYSLVPAPSSGEACLFVIKLNDDVYAGRAGYADRKFPSEINLLTCKLSWFLEAC